jgi:hypothetical protein
MTMTGKQQAGPRRLARVVMAVVLLAAALGVWVAGSPAARSSELTLNYTCTLSAFPSQQVVAQLTWNAPDSVIVGQATPSTVTVNAKVTLNPTITGALGVDGAATLQGSVDAPGTVVAPEGTIPSALQLTVPPTAVPGSGSMTVNATGTAPSMVFHQPGHATVNASTDLTLHLTLLDSAGNPAPVSNISPSCTLDPGQNTVVFSFNIVPAPTAQPATATAPTGPGTAPAPTVTGSQATITPPGPTGAAVSPTDSITTSTPTQPVVATATPPPSTGVRARDRAADFWPAGVGWWLAVAGILAVVAGVIGGVWWHIRRRRHASGH